MILATSLPPAPGRIFISYRREETAFPAGWLYDRLAERFTDGQVFKDVDSIELGDDFPEVIANAVGSCDVLLALIGDRWLTISDEHGQRRLDKPDDFVRLEIEAALQRGVLLIPILVDGATMPRVDELPPSLARIARRQALELSPSRFDFDTSRLLRVLDTTVAETQGRHPARRAAPAPPGRPRKALPAVGAVAAVVAVAALIVGLVVRNGEVQAGGDRPTTSVTSPVTSTTERIETTTRPATTRAPTNLFRGFVLRQPSLEIRAKPDLSAPIIGYLPYNTPVFIVCTAISDAVTGPGRAGGPPITTRVWDKVRTDRDGDDLGFVPDAFVKTGTTEPVADAC